MKLESMFAPAEPQGAQAPEGRAPDDGGKAFAAALEGHVASQQPESGSKTFPSLSGNKVDASTTLMGVSPKQPRAQLATARFDTRARADAVDMSTDAPRGELAELMIKPKPGKTEGASTAKTPTTPGDRFNALPERPENFMVRASHVSTTTDEQPVSVKDKAKEEKKRVVSSDDVALVARALAPSARSTSVIDTKKPEQKAERPAVGAEQISTRAKGMTEHARVGGHVDPAKKKVELTKDAAPEAKKDLELEAKKEGQAPAPVAQQVEAFKLEQPQLVKEAAPLAQVAPMMLEDPSVRAVLMPHVARMSLDTGDGERLELQLKVRDGITDVKASGPAAALMHERQGEIRVALAKEGLALGHFDLTQHGASQQQHHSSRHDGADDSAPSFARRASIASSTASISNTAASDGRVHVKA